MAESSFNDFLHLRQKPPGLDPFFIIIIYLLIAKFMSFSQ